MIRYLALGDSYTIGEDVKNEESFPFQLLYSKEGLNQSQGYLKIVATTGWTTSDLLEGIGKEKIVYGEWSFVTLLIGVNNQYQGKPISLYETEFKELLDYSINVMEGNPEKVIVVAIPDYGVTPFAKEMDRDKISNEINKYNHIAETMAKDAGAQWVDIYPLSLSAEKDTSYITTDQLHPSSFQYKLWMKEILPHVNKIISCE